MEEPPRYEEPQREVKEEKVNPVPAEKVNDEFADLIEQASTTDSTETTQDAVVAQAIRQESEYTVSQSMAAGYTSYETVTSSDWWWFYLSLDIPDIFVLDTSIIYQYVTFVDVSGEDDPWTIGCWITGADADSNIDYFIQESDEIELLYEGSEQVEDLTYDQVASQYRLEESDHAWVAGGEHAPTAPESTVSGNTARVCYFMEELPKLGRNPNDFNHEYEVHIGARVYDSADENIARELGVLVENIDQGEPAEYVVEDEDVPGDDSAASLFSTIFAAFMVIVALNF